jgi:N-acetylneuraminic acid mutarotase
MSARFCPRCGFDRWPDAQFCGGCGFDFGRLAPEPEPAGAGQPLEPPEQGRAAVEFEPPFAVEPKPSEPTVAAAPKSAFQPAAQAEPGPGELEPESEMGLNTQIWPEPEPALAPPFSYPEPGQASVRGPEHDGVRGTAAAFAIVGSAFVVLGIAFVVLALPQATPGLRPPTNLDDLVHRPADFVPIGVALLSALFALFAAAAFSARWIGAVFFGAMAFATGVATAMAVVVHADRLATGLNGQLLPSPVLSLGGSAALIVAALVAAVLIRRPRRPGTSFIAAILGIALVTATVGGAWWWLGGKVSASTLVTSPGLSSSPAPTEPSPSAPPPASIAPSPAGASPVPSSRPSSVPPGTPGQWAKAAQLPGGAVWGEGIAALASGNVLVVGGAGGPNSVDALSSTAIFDPGSATWTPVANMHERRAYPTVQVLRDGTVLVIGGSLAQRAVATAERFDPGTGVWTETGPLSVARTKAQVALLPDGRVLVAGGSNGAMYMSTTTAEIYDPSTNTWSPTASMAQPRADGIGATLPDGRIVVVGGATVSYGSGQVFGTTEIYDPASDRWSSGPSMAHARYAFDGAALSDGRILVAGGWSSTAGSAQSLASTEVLDASGDAWSDAGSLSTGRGQLRFVALADGRALAIGGLSPSYGALSSVDLFAPSGAWTATGAVPVGVFWPAAVALPDGRVLVAGGATDKNAAHLTSSTELFLPPAP